MRPALPIPKMNLKRCESRKKKQQRQRHEETLASIPEEEITEEMQHLSIQHAFILSNFMKKIISMISEASSKPLDLDLSHYLDCRWHVCLKLSKKRTKRRHSIPCERLIDFLRNNGRKGIEIQRYKGLGEMNADQLWETTMDPAKRTLIKVTLPDMVAADHMFTMLMGEEVPPRRAFIEQHALSVKNLRYLEG